MKENHIFFSNRCVQINEIDQWGLQVMVKCLCTEQRINDTGLYILLECLCAHKRDKSTRTLIFGEMVLHKRKIKWKLMIYFYQNGRVHIKEIMSVDSKFRSNVVHIASAKIPERKGSISPFKFYGQLPNCYLHVFSLVYPVGEFSLKEIRMWIQSKILFYCFRVWCEWIELESRGSLRFPYITSVVKNAQTESHLEFFQTSTMELLSEKSRWE